MAPVLRCAWKMKNHHQTKKCSYGILTVGTHQATRVAATCRGDILQRQIAWYVPENFCENLCRSNRILSPQKDPQFCFVLFFFCDLLQKQNSVAETSIFTKILRYKRSDLSPRRIAATSRPTCTHWVICRQLVAWCVHTNLFLRVLSYSAPGAREGWAGVEPGNEVENTLESVKGQMNQNFDLFYFSSILVKCV